MKQKINIRFVLVSLLAIAATTLCMTVIYYHLFENQVRRDLKIEAELIRDAGILDKNHPQKISMNVESLRITWVDTDGTVLYDNEKPAETLENHLDRPEIEEALADGEGETVRTSDTMKTNTFYYALQLEDQTVLRVSKEASSIGNVFFTGLPMVLLVVAIIIAICILLTHFLTRQLLAPIDKMAESIGDDTLDYTKYNCYKEMIPFMNTIRSQHENILQAAKSRQDFTANVSHELKTPLTAISGYAQLIENHMVGPEEETRFAREIEANANRLLSLINDIIRLSEMDNSNVAVTYEAVDLSSIAQKCVENMQMNAKEASVNLTFEGAPCVIRANQFMLSELVENLCSNAIRYNNVGGYVHVRVTNQDGNAVLSVEDNGIGIPKDQQERIFERFYRVDKSRSKETGGTGLGLAIVKHIVALHDAQITLESEPQKGTTIRVRF